MYCEGVCPDYGYSFTGKPPPTASLIMKYIEKNMAPTPPSSSTSSSSSAVTVVSNKIKNGKIINKSEDRIEMKDDMKIKNEDEIENEKLSEKEKERAERIERSRLKVEEIELEMNTRAAAIHALRVAMNCKSDYKGLNKYSKILNYNNSSNMNGNANQLTQAENAKKFQNYLSSMRNKVAVSKLMCK